MKGITEYRNDILDRLPGPVNDVVMPGEESGGANVTVEISVNGKTIGAGTGDDPLLESDPPSPQPKEQEELRDPRTGLLALVPEPTTEMAPRTTFAIENGLTVGMPDEASADRLRERPLFPRLPRQVPDPETGMNPNSGPTVTQQLTREYDGGVRLDAVLPKEVAAYETWRQK